MTDLDKNTIFLSLHPNKQITETISKKRAVTQGIYYKNTVSHAPEVFLNGSRQFKILKQIRHIIFPNKPHFIWKPIKVPYLFMSNKKGPKIQDKNTKMWMGIQLRSEHGQF